MENKKDEKQNLMGKLNSSGEVPLMPHDSNVEVNPAPVFQEENDGTVPPAPTAENVRQGTISIKDLMSASASTPAMPDISNMPMPGLPAMDGIDLFNMPGSGAPAAMGSSEKIKYEKKVMEMESSSEKLKDVLVDTEKKFNTERNVWETRVKDKQQELWSAKQDLESIKNRERVLRDTKDRELKDTRDKLENEIKGLEHKLVDIREKSWQQAMKSREEEMTAVRVEMAIKDSQIRAVREQKDREISELRERMERKMVEQLFHTRQEYETKLTAQDELVKQLKEELKEKERLLREEQRLYNQRLHAKEEEILSYKNEYIIRETQTQGEYDSKLRELLSDKKSYEKELLNREKGYDKNVELWQEKIRIKDEEIAALKKHVEGRAEEVTAEYRFRIQQMEDEKHQLTGNIRNLENELRLAQQAQERYFYEISSIRQKIEAEFVGKLAEKDVEISRRLAESKNTVDEQVTQKSKEKDLRLREVEQEKTRLVQDYEEKIRKTSETYETMMREAREKLADLPSLQLRTSELEKRYERDRTAWQERIDEKDGEIVKLQDSFSNERKKWFASVPGIEVVQEKDKNIRELETQIFGLKQELAGVNAQLVSAGNALEKAKAREAYIDELELEVLNLQQELAKTKKNLVEAQHGLESASGNEELRQKVAYLTGIKEEQEKNVETLRTEIEILKAELQDSTASVTAKQKQIDALVSEAGGLKQQQEELKHKLIFKQNDIAALQESWKNKEEDIKKQHEAELVQLKAKLSSLAGNPELEAVYKKTAAERNIAIKRAADLETEIIESKRQLARFEDEVMMFNTKVKRLETELASKKDLLSIQRDIKGLAPSVVEEKQYKDLEIAYQKLIDENEGVLEINHQLENKITEMKEKFDSMVVERDSMKDNIRGEYEKQVAQIIDGYKKRIGELETQQKQRPASEVSGTDELAYYKTRLAELQKGYEALLKEKQDYKRHAEELKNTWQEMKDKTVLDEVEQKRLEARIADLKAQLEVKGKEFIDTKKQMQELVMQEKERTLNLEAQNVWMKKDVEQKDQVIAELEKRLADVERIFGKKKSTRKMFEWLNKPMIDINKKQSGQAKNGNPKH
ncbi:MAG: hypothetical protein WC955_02460 [Elusimicrobiota bacterium]